MARAPVVERRLGRPPVERLRLDRTPVVRSPMVRRAVGVARRVRVWLLVLALAAGAAVVWAMAPHGPGTFSVSHGHTAWFALMLGFVVTDAYLVHVNVGRHAHSFSFAFVPLVLGLFLLPPDQLLSARLLGGACALTILRRQPVKMAFNLAQFALGLGVATVEWAHFGV